MVIGHAFCVLHHVIDYFSSSANCIHLQLAIESVSELVIMVTNGM